MNEKLDNPHRFNFDVWVQAMNNAVKTNPIAVCFILRAINFLPNQHLHQTKVLWKFLIENQCSKYTQILKWAKAVAFNLGGQAIAIPKILATKDQEKSKKFVVSLIFHKYSEILNIVSN